jgi:hypothetical protein
MTGGGFVVRTWIVKIPLNRGGRPRCASVAAKADAFDGGRGVSIFGRWQSSAGRPAPPPSLPRRFRFRRMRPADVPPSPPCSGRRSSVRTSAAPSAGPRTREIRPPGPRRRQPPSPPPPRPRISDGFLNRDSADGGNRSRRGAAIIALRDTVSAFALLLSGAPVFDMNSQQQRILPSPQYRFFLRRDNQFFFAAISIFSSTPFTP